MTRKFLCLLIVFLLSYASTVQAKVDPYIEDPESEWGDLAEPAVMWSPRSAAVHAGGLGAVDDIDSFRLKFDEALEDWPFELIVPQCGDAFEAFFPSMALVGPGLDTPEPETLPFDLPEGMGALVFSEERYKQQYAEQERRSIIPRSTLTGQPSYFHTRRSLDIPQAGEYLLVVYEPEGNMGAYMLMTGDGHDQFGPRPQKELQAAFDLFFSGEWMGEGCGWQY